MKTLMAIIILTISSIASAQEDGSRVVIPMTVTGGTIEIDFGELPPIMAEDGMTEAQRTDVAVALVRLNEEERQELERKMNLLFEKRMSRFYEHSNYIDVIDGLEY